MTATTTTTQQIPAFHKEDAPANTKPAAPKQRERQRVLDDADQIVSIDRATQYGDAQDNFERIAGIWTALLGTKIHAKQVALMLAGMKLARLAHNPEHRDSWVDVIGYAALGAEVKS